MTDEMNINEKEKEITTEELALTEEKLEGEENSISIGQKSETPSEADALKDQLLRTLAEFDNYKKRSQRDMSQFMQAANEKLILELLPVIDDMERAIKVSKEITSDDAKVQQFVQGVEFIYKKIVKTLEAKGLKAIESIGMPLDVNLHDALIQIDAPDTEPNTVVDEHEKGYYLYDKVIRHAKVIVSK
ncbi:nucleotide exchange factor GrpE [bacterium]|nr:MAG: nucleotide exchange factor GrpE [bacterium]MBL7958901.1 nucleotide exchange factor GrpE [bacterium]